LAAVTRPVALKTVRQYLESAGPSPGKQTVYIERVPAQHEGQVYEWRARAVGVELEAWGRNRVDALFALERLMEVAVRRR
jgi:hypothetical protein